MYIISISLPTGLLSNNVARLANPIYGDPISSKAIFISLFAVAHILIVYFRDFNNWFYPSNALIEV